MKQENLLWLISKTALLHNLLISSYCCITSDCTSKPTMSQETFMWASKRAGEGRFWYYQNTAGLVTKHAYPFNETHIQTKNGSWKIRPNPPISSHRLPTEHTLSSQIDPAFVDEGILATP